MRNAKAAAVLSAPPIATGQCGLSEFLGKSIAVFCTSYIYTGRLVDFSDTCIKLENPYIVYETGPLTAPNWKDAQQLTGPFHYVALVQVESFGPGK